VGRVAHQGLRKARHDGIEIDGGAGGGDQQGDALGSKHLRYVGALRGQGETFAARGGAAGSGFARDDAPLERHVVGADPRQGIRQARCFQFDQPLQAADGAEFVER
jgi:hypothetical protein